MKNKIIFIVAIITVFTILMIKIYPKLSYVIATRIHYSTENQPEAYIVLQENFLNSSQEFSRINTKAYGHGYTFNPPTMVISRKEISPNIVHIKLENSRLVALIKMELMDDEIDTTTGWNSSDFSVFFRRCKVINTTPNDISVFSSMTEIREKASHLVEKNNYTSLGDPIFKFSVNRIKGFQYGDPSKGNKVTVIFFNAQNEEFRILFFNFSRQEIDTVLSTIAFNTEDK